MDDIILYLLEYLLLKPVGTLGYSMSAVRIACRRRRINWGGPTKTRLRATAGVAR